MLSKRRMFALAQEISALLDTDLNGQIDAALKEGTYASLKRNGKFDARGEVKRDVRTMALKGWVNSTEDEEWRLKDEGV